MTSPVRLGYVGCGFMAQKVHLPNFASLGNCRLLALAEVREDLRASVGDRFRVPRRYASHLEMAEDTDLDAVAISAGYALQGEMAADFLLRGKPVFMEKPMATTVDRAEALLAAARTGGGRLMIGYMKRFDAGNELALRTVREFRASGELGSLTCVRAHGFCGDWVCGLDTPLDGSSEPAPPSPVVVPAWVPSDRAAGYLGYLQQYTHNVNLVRWLLDAGSDARVRFVDLDADGMAGVAVLDVGGVRVLLESGRVSHHRWDEHTQVYFEHGWVRADAPPLLLRNQPAEVEVYRSRPEPSTLRPVPQPAWTWSYRREAEHFIACVSSGEPFASSAEDTLTDVRLLEEIYRTWLAGRGELAAAGPAQN